MKKRLLAISNHGVMLGGGEHSFLDLLSHLPPQWDVLAVIPEEGELGLRLKSKGIPQMVLPLPSMKPWYAKEMISALMAFKKTIRRYRPDLIYANGPRTAFYGGIAGRLTRLPVIWHCRIADHDPCLDWLLTRLSHRIITNSQATAQRFMGSPRRKIHVVHNGIDIDWFSAEACEKPGRIEPGWKVLLMVGRVSKWKRHDLALTAFERVAKIVPEAYLVCLGAKDNLEPGWWDRLRMMSLHSPFSGRIHWVGQVEDIRPWLRSACLLLLPSDNEPFGRVLVEAMATGVPVIGTRSGGVPEIVREGIDGLLVAPGNAIEMSDAILKLINDVGLRNRFLESGRKRAEEFSLENHVNRMVQVFEETLEFHAKRVRR